jgi:hypothetical protein
LFYQCDDRGYWDLRENIHVFGHPTLEFLTIRRAKLDERGFESLEQPSETGLRELHLLECDINDDALSDILLMPEALKVITITQLEVPSPPLEHSPDDIEDYILALRSAHHSLHAITIDFATLGAENALRLREFDTLKSLRLRDFQFFGQSLGNPRLHSAALPPNLEVLEFFNALGEDDEVMELLCYTLENSGITARKLRELVVVEGERGLPSKFLEACEAAEDLMLQVRSSPQPISPPRSPLEFSRRRLNSLDLVG